MLKISKMEKEMEIDKNKDTILYQKYMDYIQEDVLPRAQSRLLENLRKENSELAAYALERMRTYEWRKNTRFVSETHINTQLEVVQKKTERKMNEQMTALKKGMTVLAVTSAAISMICLSIMLYMFL